MIAQGQAKRCRPRSAALTWVFGPLWCEFPGGLNAADPNRFLPPVRWVEDASRGGMVRDYHG